MEITWNYNDALRLVPDEYTAVLREDADAAIEHLSRITDLLAQRLNGELSIDGLARLTLSTSDALDLLEQYPNRPRPTTADDVQQTVELIEMVRRWAMVKLHQQTKQERDELIQASKGVLDESLGVLWDVDETDPADPFGRLQKAVGATPTNSLIERDADLLAAIAHRWNKKADAMGDGAMEIKGAALALMCEANKIRQQTREATSHE